MSVVTGSTLPVAVCVAGRVGILCMCVCVRARMYVSLWDTQTASLLAEPAHGKAAVTSIDSSGLKGGTSRPQKMPEAVSYKIP